MADITITRSLNNVSALTDDQVRTTLVQCLKEDFDKFITNQHDTKKFSGRVKTKMFNPVVSFRGQMRLARTGAQTNVLISVNTTTNGWFWFTIIWGFVFPFTFLLLWWLYVSQKKRGTEAFEGALKRADFIGAETATTESHVSQRKQIASYCTSCGTAISPTERFCRTCGTPTTRATHANALVES